MISNGIYKFAKKMKDKQINLKLMNKGIKMKQLKNKSIINKKYTRFDLNPSLKYFTSEPILSKWTLADFILGFKT